MMNEIFQGWKRKIGMLTLVLSSVLVIGWTNSFRRTDLFTLPLGPLPVGGVISSHGRIGCAWADPKAGQLLPTWEVSPDPIDFANCALLFEFQDDKRYWRGLRPMTLVVSFGSVSLPSSQYNQVEWKPGAEDLELADAGASNEKPTPLDDVGSSEELVEQYDESDVQLTQSAPQQINLTNATIAVPSTALAAGTVTLTNANSPAQFTFSANSTFKRFGVWSVPYWSIAIPLTILSLWLLLSKVPTSKRPPSSEPVTESVR